MAQIYTVAQALQTSASGLTVVDTAANIAAIVGNAGLLSRVAVFDLLSDDAIDATRATQLATLGTKFSRAGYTLTIRDTVAALTSAGNSPALTVGNAVQVLDTAANILAAANNPIIHNAHTISVNANSTLSLAQLLLLESWPVFTAAGTTITLADTASNLLAVTPAQTKPA